MVTDDMPFLVDSLVMELNRHGASIHLMVHPILHVVRDAQGLLIEIAGPTTKGARAESVIHVEIDRETDPGEISVLRDDLRRVLADVRAAVEDRPAMRAALARAIETVSSVPSRVLPDHPVEELRAFLEWLAEGNFTLLGCRDHVRDAPGTDLRPVAGSGLGIWRDPPAGSQDRPGHGPAESLGASCDAGRALTTSAAITPVVITKASTRSTVHRPSYLDYIGVRRFGDDGLITGELGFLGLHVSEVYHGDPKAIPLLRHKIEAVMARAAFASEGHSARALQYILESYPRDELFQISLDELCETALGILHLQERPRVRLFVRRDPYGRFLSCLVFVPRDRYNTDLRERMQAILREAVNAFEVDFNVSLAESPLARIHFMARTRPGGRRRPSRSATSKRASRRPRAPGPIGCTRPSSRPTGRRRATTSRGVIERPFPRPIARTTRRAMRCTTSLGSRRRSRAAPSSCTWPRPATSPTISWSSSFITRPSR